MTNYQGRHYKTGKAVNVQVENGLIKKIENISVDVENIIAPGLFDNQVNGYKGIGFTQPGLNVSDIKQVIKDLQEIGVTSFLPTMITAPKSTLIKNLQTFREYLVGTHNCVRSHNSDSIPGIHLEGPYISPLEGFRGAHNPEWIRKPDIAEFDELYEASGGIICHLTLAPELDGAIDLIKHCRNKGVTVGLAHHNANADQINKAVEAGAGLSVHLGNGIANTISRHENPIWPQLANDSLMISLICDGFHLTPEEIKSFYKIKGPEKTILTSDCTDLAGMPPGEYFWDGKKVILETEGLIRYPAQNVLAGAASPLIRDIGIMMNTTGCSLSEVIQMASYNPARFHGFTDRGGLEVGQNADLILFNIVDGQIRLHKTVKGGEVVFEK